MTVDWKYRTFWRRTGASLVDFLVVLPLIAAQIALVGAQLHPMLKVVLFVFCVASGHAYSVVMHWRLGATLGKMAVGVKVLSVTEEPLTLRQAFMREAINIGYGVYQAIRSISLFIVSMPTSADLASLEDNFGTLLLGLELVTTLTNAKRRSVHDFVAGTVVVRTRAEAGA